MYLCRHDETQSRCSVINSHHVRQVEASTLMGKVPETLHPCGRHLHSEVIPVRPPEETCIRLIQDRFRLSGPDALRAQQDEQSGQQHDCSSLWTRTWRNSLRPSVDSLISAGKELLTTSTKSQSQRCDNVSMNHYHAPFVFQVSWNFTINITEAASNLFYLTCVHFKGIDLASWQRISSGDWYRPYICVVNMKPVSLA